MRRWQEPNPPWASLVEARRVMLPVVILTKATMVAVAAAAAVAVVMAVPQVRSAQRMLEGRVVVVVGASVPTTASMTGWG